MPAFAGVLCWCLMTSDASAQASDQLHVTPNTAEPASSDPSWTATIGGGLAVLPDYEGSEDYEFLPLPLIDLTWNDRLFLNVRRGIGVYAIKSEQLQLGASVGFGRGRDEDDSDQLEGLGDVDPAARAHIFGSYSVGRFNVFADLSRDVGGSDGAQIELGGGFRHALARKVMVSGSLSATWADENYMDAFFGVSQLQSQRSGLTSFDAEAGLKRTDLQFSTTWLAGDSWFYSANLGLGVLLDDARYSPVTQDEIQGFLGLAVGYKY